jgi:PAS domain S-box-containing protein
MQRRHHERLPNLPDAFFRTHPMPMLLTDGSPPGILDANVAFNALIGGLLPAGEALQSLFTDPPLRLDGTRCRTRLHLLSGALRDVEVTAQQVESAALSPCLLTVRDLGAEREAALRQRASDALVGIAGETAGIGGWHYDLATQRVTWTERTYRLFGVNIAQDIDAAFALSLYAPGHRERLVEAVETCAQDGKPYDMDLVAIDTGGGRFPVRAIGVPVRDERGRIVALQGAVQDLRPVREAARTFAESWDRFERLADAMPHIVWTALPDGTLDYISATFLSQFEESHAFDIARDWPQAIHPDDRDENQRLWAEAVDRGTVFEMECRIRRGAAADFRWHRIVAQPVRDGEGRIVRWFGTSTDIHELWQTRAQTAHLAAQLQTILDSITDALITVDANYDIRFLNRTAQQVLRQDAAALIGRNLYDAFPDAVGTIFEREYRAVLASGQTRTFQGYYPPLGIWIDVSAYPSEGGIAIYFRDVTASHEHEQRLKLLQLAIERISDTVLITEAEPLGEPGPRIQFVNDAFTRSTGYTAEEAIGRSPRILQGPGTERAELDRIRAALQTWQPVREELLNYRKDGTPFWIELDITPLVDSDGFCTHWIAVQRDITERKAAEEAAARRAAQLETDNAALRRLTAMSGPRHRAIASLVAEAGRLAGAQGAAFLESGGGGIRVTEANGIATALPRTAAADSDGLWARAVARGETVLAAMTDTPPAPPELAALAAAGAQAAAVTPVETGTLLVAFTEPGHPDPDRLNSLQVYARTAESVLQRIRVEDQLREAQRLESLGHLTGGIAHDFNNLLTIMLGNADMLVESLAHDETLRPLAELTQTAAARGAELTSRLLAFARKQPLDPQPTDVRALMDGMSLILARTLGTSIELAVSHGEALWPTLIDAPQLENAVLNLCLNARDAMPNGGQLTIETRNVQLDGDYADSNVEVAPGDYVLIAVSDTGTGMAPEVRDRAFEPFFTTKAHGAGSGLGLSMVFGFAKQSRGHVQLYSELGQGTTVKLYLPRAAEPAPSLQEPAGSTAFGGQECILVVEDNALVREHVTSLLKGLGYRVIVAPDATKALETLRTGEPVDLLFTDIVMPGGMDGRQLGEAARSLRPGLPVLFTSGYTEMAVTRQGRLDGPMHLLNKPYRRIDLASKLRSLLQHTTDGSKA